VLAVSPVTLELSEEKPQAAISLTTMPSGGRLDWKVTASPDWVRITPSSGKISGDIVEVSVSAPDLATAQPGQRSGRIELVSNGGTAFVNVVATVAARRTLSVKPATLHFTQTQDTATFYIHGTGNLETSWSVPAPGHRLNVAPRSGSLAPGDSVRLVVVANRDGLPVGTTNLSLKIESNADHGAIDVPVRVDVPAQPRIVVSPAMLCFASKGTAKSFTIANPGTGMLTWSAQPTSAWLTISPASGSVAPGGQVSVNVTLDGGALPGPEAESSVTITSDAKEGERRVPVTVSSSTGWCPGLHALDHRVIDAEYNRAADLLVTVSANPARLNIIDSRLGTVHSVALALAPTAVSIAPSGLFAAVGHDGHVSYVDLVARSVVRVYAVTTDALDVVLPGNGWVYVFPRRDQWESIRSIKLETGVETTSGGWSIYAGTVARLHPSGDFMYGANRGLSPSDFEKYDIRKGTAAVLYDSPYHGDYDFSGDIWISDDGNRLFARSGNVFRSSPVQQEDMLYAGKLPGISFARWVEHSSAANRIYAFDSPNWGSTPATVLRVYDPAYLNFLGTVPLPKFVVPATGAEYDAHGQFVFVDSTGKWVYMLVQADPVSGMAKDWGLAVVKRSDVP
jgi:hypothetical protein